MFRRRTTDAPPRRDLTPLRGVVRLAWRMPLFAIPFALFFGTLFGKGGGLVAYRDAYFIALHFAYVIGLLMWAADHLVVRRLFPPGTRDSLPAALRIGGIFCLTSIAGVFVAALIAEAVIPIFSFGGARGFLTLGMFAVLFTGLFGAANLAAHFYQQALEKVRAEEELKMARRIQRSFLRETFPNVAGWDIHAANISSKHVSGDFYDVVHAGDGAVLLAIADVSGKGVPAALQSSLLQASLRTQALEDRSVPRMLSTINTLLHESTTPGQFATFVLARVETKTRRVVYANAGHNHPILVRASGEAAHLDKGGVPLGVLPVAHFEEGALTMAPGDRLVFFTDGISEAANGANATYGDAQVESFVRALPRSLSAREAVEHIVSDVRRHLDGVEAGDDMTVLVVQVL